MSTDCDNEEVEKVCPQDTSIPTVDNTASDCCHEHFAKCITGGINVAGYGIVDSDTIDIIISKLVSKINNLQSQISDNVTDITTNTDAIAANHP